jgi:hypothetical protein
MDSIVVSDREDCAGHVSMGCCEVVIAYLPAGMSANFGSTVI